ncbi:MAG: hypothetical protein ABI685_10745 [Ferruginibacter sp.]
MKQFKFLAAVCFAAGMSFSISSCNNGDEKKADDKPADSSGVKAPETAPAKPANLMVVMHKVANFTKWVANFESTDSLKNAYGLHNYVLARGIKDTNMLMVVLKMDDAAKAKEFAALPELKAAMQKGGVISAPAITYMDVQMQDNSENTASTRMMVTHKVKDWDAWKKVYDDDKANRMNAGLTDRVLSYSIGDNHQVSMVFLVSDMKKAEDFSNSPELKAKMEAGGVEGPPTFFYYTIAKKY